MKLFCIINFWLLFHVITVNAQWTDNFDDGNFNENPSWKDDSSVFMVNPAGQLQLNAPAKNNKSVIYIESETATNATWEFDVFMGFNPSSSNYCRVYLMANNALPKNIINGYFLKIGNTNDDISLYYQNGSSETLLIDGRDKMLNSSMVSLSIKVTRDNIGKWELYCDTTANRNYTFLGESFENSTVQSSFLVIECVYTATRSDKFSFDNFIVTGETYSDGTIPYLTGVKPLSANKLKCSFSEAIENPTIDNFLLNNSEPLGIDYQQNTVTLQFSENFNCTSDNILILSRISDIWKNTIQDTSINFRYCTPGLFDVVFNEIMADPSPSVDLPDAEYIELFNRSDKILPIYNWKLIVGDNQYPFPDTAFIPNTYIILCKESSIQDFRKFGTTLGIFNSSTLLNNSGQNLKLLNAENKLVAFINYNDSWYNDGYKAEGGWSLEQIDPMNPCAGYANWTASNNSNGGSPGNINSVFKSNPDIELPEMNWLFVPNDSSIQIIFNEPLLSPFPLKNEDFVITPDIGIKSLIPANGINYTSIVLKTFGKIEPGKKYQLSIPSNISDCVGNTIASSIDTIIGLPEAIDSLDIIINEVLFNPMPQCPEYIELYNKSGKIVNGANLVVSVCKDGNVSTFKASIDTFLFYPHSYLLISPEPNILPKFYNKYDKHFFHLTPNWNSLDDKTATIKLLTKNLKTIDAFTYAEAMHYLSIKNKEGISIERVDPELPSDYSGNWHSASETSGYGTPGLPNSQKITKNESEKIIEIEYEIFSPDNDGYNDQLVINYSNTTPGDRVSAMIFDATGKRIRQLLNNVAPGNNTIFTWDGISDEGKLCYPGIYLLFFRIINDNGEITEFKKSCILAIKR